MTDYKWVKARDGAIFGVCKGLARSLEMPIGLFRILWVLSVLFMGVGLGVYIMLAICLPYSDEPDKALRPMFLGVCAKVAEKTNMEVGIARFLALLLLFMSLGTTFIGYLILYFVLEDKETSPSSRI
jgi:phage shock protein PspC (stress-responsive transcriptional regulator)